MGIPKGKIKEVELLEEINELGDKIGNQELAFEADKEFVQLFKDEKNSKKIFR